MSGHLTELERKAAATAVATVQDARALNDPAHMVLVTVVTANGSAQTGALWLSDSDAPGLDDLYRITHEGLADCWRKRIMRRIAAKVTEGITPIQVSGEDVLSG